MICLMKTSPVIALLLLMTLLPACNRNQQTDSTPVIRPIRTHTVGPAEPLVTHTFSGIAAASAETKLSFRVGGKIEQLPVTIGMKVHKGQLIAALDPTDYALAVKQAEAALAQAQAQLTRAKAEYERDRQLFEAEDISLSRLDASLALFRSSRAQTDAAKEAVALATHQLQYTRLLAPADGTIAAVPVEAHQTIAAGQPIAVLSAGGNLEMAVGVPEALIAQVKVGEQAHIIFDALAPTVFDGEVVEVGIQATHTATYPVRLRIQTDDDQLRPGMVGECAFTFRTPEPFLTIPLEAVLTIPSGKRFVWVYRKEQENVTQREITAGKLVSSGIQVLSGLHPGDIIAVRGVHRLSEAMKVKLLSPNPTGPQGSAP